MNGGLAHFRAEMIHFQILQDMYTSSQGQIQVPKLLKNFGSMPPPRPLLRGNGGGKGDVKVLKPLLAQVFLHQTLQKLPEKFRQHAVPRGHFCVAMAGGTGVQKP